MAVLAGFFVVYFLLLVAFLVGWKRAMQEHKRPAPRRPPLVSVVIPARNEALVIGNLLDDLAQQEYKKFEIIVVDDHSEDETVWVVTHSGLNNIGLITNRGDGKKASIAAGVRHAKGSLVVTTDADCSVSPQWLRGVVREFQDPEVMMAFGGVRMQGERRFFDALQAIEFSSLIGSGAATAALGFPTICNGANLAFRKKVFAQVGGYADNLHVPSGDDEFLMRKIQSRYPRGIRFINDPQSVVTTAVQPGPLALLNQRIRWASKWRYNSSPHAKALAAFVFILQLAFVANWLLISSPLILQSVFLIAVKIILEAALLLQVCRFLQIRWNWLAFLSLQVLYPPYVLLVAVASFFMPFRWKNRIFKPETRFPWGA